MRRFVLSAAVLSSTALLPLACNVEAPDAPKEEVEKGEDAIIGGTLDTTNKAVMWVLDEAGGFSCSGTMIAKNGSTGYVLTAGHCENMTVVVQADDYEDCFEANNPGCEGVYVVQQDIPHPNWNGDPGDGYDFRILRVNGASGAPVIPAAQSPDGISNNVSIEVSGYGRTTTGNGPNSNSQRRHVTETVLNYDALTIYADQTDGTGSCNGDSGGPVIRGGKVVGVTSWGDQGCYEIGAYGRVQAVYNTWIAGIIGQVVQPTCDDCFLDAQNNACASRTDSCADTPDCTDLLECFDGCSTNPCYQDCIDAHPTGYNLYTALVNCACNACAVECEDECGGSSTTTTTGSGPGPMTATAQQSSAAAGMGGFGDGGSGAGGADSDDGGTKKKKKSDDDDDDDDDDTQTIDSCACATPGSPAAGGMSGSLGLAGLGALAGVLVRRRRRR